MDGLALQGSRRISTGSPANSSTVWEQKRPTRSFISCSVTCLPARLTLRSTLRDVRPSLSDASPAPFAPMRALGSPRKWGRGVLHHRPSRPDGCVVPKCCREPSESADNKARVQSTGIQSQDSLSVSELTHYTPSSPIQPGLTHSPR